MKVSWMPGEESSSRVRIGRRRLVTRASPGRGVMRSSQARACSMERNSFRAAALKAQVSQTWVPWVLMIRIAWPRSSRTARPQRAGTA